MRIYHQRQRDGERVVWSHEAGERIRRHDRGTIDPACQILIAILGPVVAERLCEAFAAELAPPRGEWDLTTERILDWARRKFGAGA